MPYLISAGGWVSRRQDRCEARETHAAGLAAVWASGRLDVWNSKGLGLVQRDVLSGSAPWNPHPQVLPPRRLPLTHHTTLDYVLLREHLPAYRLPFLACLRRNRGARTAMTDFKVQKTLGKYLGT